jgi:hypothetical protein
MRRLLVVLLTICAVMTTRAQTPKGDEAAIRAALDAQAAAWNHADIPGGHSRVHADV